MEPRADVDPLLEPPVGAQERIDRAQLISRAIAAGLVVPATGALAPAIAEASPSASGKTLRIRAEFDLQSVDNAYESTFIDEQVVLAVNEGLVSYKPGTWDVVNTLAQEFDQSPDGLRFKFKLKRGIPFHKGYGEVTASDVKYSYERIAGLTKPNLHSPYAGDWATLSHVKVTSKYEGTVILKARFAPMMRTTMPINSGLVLSQKAIEKLGKKYNHNPIGTGPYEFTKWVPKQQIVLTKFADYGKANSAYTKPAEWDQIILLPIPEDSSAETALQSGDIDFTSIPTNAIDRFQANSQFSTVTKPTLNYTWMSMNVKDPTLSDRNVRRAIRQAIDVPSIITAAADGKFERLNAIIPKSMGMGYWPGAPQYDRDVDKAKQYLAAASPAAREGAKNLTLTILNAEQDKTVAQVIQANLADIGINLRIQTQDNATFNAIPGGGGGGPHRQLVYTLFTTQPDPSWSTVWFTCAQVKQWNWGEWCSPLYERPNNAALKTSDPARRTQLYIQVQKAWDKEANMVWIWNPTLTYSGKKSIKPSLRPDGTVLYWDFRSV
jgi:peptide/nickel transport system substrate-binding protein